MKLAVANFLFAFLALSTLGCGLQLDAEPDPSLNTCSSNSECGSEGVCVETQTGETRCVATSAELGNIIVEVRPSGGTTSLVFFDETAAQPPFVVAGQNPNGLLQPLDIALPASVGVIGSIAAPEGLAESCIVDDGSATGVLPVDVTLVRRVD